MTLFWFSLGALLLGMGIGYFIGRASQGTGAAYRTGMGIGFHDGWRAAHKVALLELAKLPFSRGGKNICKVLAKGPPDPFAPRTTSDPLPISTHIVPSVASGAPDGEAA